MTRLVLEIEGLAAAGRLPVGPGFVRGRAQFVADCLRVRGASPKAALTGATLLNAAYSGLETDLLVTGDHERVEAGLEALCTWVDTLTCPEHH